ncbi:MAG: hypothetical protein AAF551_06475, partial [Bacteroidota bacterium]
LLNNQKKRLPMLNKQFLFRVVQFLPRVFPKDDPKQRKPDISLAKKVLNWEPKFTRAEGLKPTLEYFTKKVLE